MLDPQPRAGETEKALVKEQGRVRFVEDGSRWPFLGTVVKVSPMGYVSVRWDEQAYAIARFGPRSAAKQLVVVIGEEARPRHAWDQKGHRDEPRCAVCGVEQTEANWLEACDEVRRG